MEVSVGEMDEQAIREVGDSWHPFIGGLRAFVARRVPSRDAEDVAQDVVLRLHQGAASLREAARAESWVYGIARRAIADYYRARDPRSESAETATLEGLADPEASPAKGFADYPGEHSVHEEVLSWLRPMAEALPEHDRRPLILADFEGWSQRRVADELGLSLSGAKSRIQRARKKLGEELGRCCAVELDGDGRAIDFRRRDCDC